MHKTLINAVDRQCGGLEEIAHDVVNHGANAGYAGFTYSVDCAEFFKKNRKAIMDLAQNLADDMGIDTLEMIAGFNCLKHSKYKPYEIMQKLNDKNKTSEVIDAMAWFALEEVSRDFVENREHCGL